MCNISKLGLIASRLYIALLLHGEALNEQPKTKIMQMVGTGRAQTLSDAMDELERWGFARVERTIGVRSRVVLARSAPLVPPLSSAEGVLGGCHPPRPTEDTNPITLSKYVSKLEGSLNGSTGGSNNHPNTTVLTLPQQSGVDVTQPQHSGVDLPQHVAVEVSEPQHRSVDVPQQQAVEVPLPQHSDVEVSLLERCIEIDAMPYGEDRISPKGDFQKRRRAQMPLVVEVWKHFFPGGKELLTANIKELLVLCNDSLETLYEELEFAAERAKQLAERKGVAHLEYAYGYAKKTIEGRVKERGAAQQGTKPPLSSAAPVRPRVGAEAYVPGGDLPPPSPEYLAKVREAEQNFERMRKERGWVE